MTCNCFFFLSGYQQFLNLRQTTTKKDKPRDIEVLLGGGVYIIIIISCLCRYIHIYTIHIYTIHVYTIHVYTIHVYTIHVYTIHVYTIHVYTIHVYTIHVYTIHVYTIHVYTIHVYRYTHTHTHTHTSKLNQRSPFTPRQYPHRPPPPQRSRDQNDIICHRPPHA